MIFFLSLCNCVPKEGYELVVDVDLVKYTKSLAFQSDANLDRLLSEIEKKLEEDPSFAFKDVVMMTFNNGNSELSAYFGEPYESDEVVLASLVEHTENVMHRTMEILDKRIDQFGVRGARIKRIGTQRITVFLPGVQDSSRVSGLIGRTAQLEFKLIAEEEKYRTFLQDVDEYLAINQSTDDEEEDTGISFPDDGYDSSHLPFTSLLNGVRGDVAVMNDNLWQVEVILADSVVVGLIPQGYELLWALKPVVYGPGANFQLLYMVKSKPELTGAAIADARVDISSSDNSFRNAGSPMVSLTFSRKGADQFAQITGDNIDKRLAIVLDERVYMAPVIRGKIPGGRAIIEGSFTRDEAQDLAIVLRAGALPTSIKIVEVRARSTVK